MIDPQSQLFPTTESTNIDSLWSTWQLLSEPERDEFLNRVRNVWLIQRPAENLKHEITEPPHCRRRRRN